MIETRSMESRLADAEKEIDLLCLSVEKSMEIVKRQEQTIRILETRVLETALEMDVPQLGTSVEKETGNVYPSAMPKSFNSSETMYKRALAAYYEGNYTGALSLFELFLLSGPVPELADNAVYWTGECHYAQKNYHEAIRAFLKVTMEYPSGNKRPDALFKTGYSYLCLEELENARMFFRKTAESYPSSRLAVKAEKMLISVPAYR